jgi:hypothetical protein
VYNKPNGRSATGTLAPGPDHQQQLSPFINDDDDDDNNNNNNVFPRDIVCFRNICINTLHKGDNDDDDNNNNTVPPSYLPAYEFGTDSVFRNVGI